jgi:toxin FitB
MLVLDTNVVSELMKPMPDQAVRTWLNEQDYENFYLCSMSWYELLFGIESLPAGRRKNTLKLALLSVRDDLFANRILAFDEQAASLLSKQMANAQRKGAGASLEDGQIAAIALRHGYTVVSRDVKPFQALGVKVINPCLN